MATNMYPGHVSAGLRRLITHGARAREAWRNASPWCHFCQLVSFSQPYGRSWSSTLTAWPPWTMYTGVEGTSRSTGRSCVHVARVARDVAGVMYPRLAGVT
jgi:hypothetical protein